MCRLYYYIRSADIIMISLANLPTLLSYRGCRDYYNIPTKSAEFIIGTPSTDPSRLPMTSSEPTSSLNPLITPITQKDLMMMGINSATFTSLLLYTYYVLIYWTLNRSCAKTDRRTKVFFLHISFFTYGEWYF